MNARCLIFVITALAVSGCGRSTELKTQSHPNVSLNADLSGGLALGLVDDSWEETGGAGFVAEIPDYKPGDLTPCPDELAEFTLEVNATHAGRSFYRRQQSF